MINRTDTPLQARNYSPNSEVLMGRYDIKSDWNLSPLEDLAKEKGVNADFLVQLINSSYEPSTASVSDFDSYSIPTLVDYLERSHRYYLQTRLPEIEQSISAMKWSNTYHPICVLVSRFFAMYVEELGEHFLYEEQKLFPYAKFLCRSKEQWHLIPALRVFLGQYSTTEFINKHDDSNKDELREIREALMKYEPPQENKFPYHILLDQLKSFEEDLQLHALIEDKVLVPKMVVLETLLNA